MKRTEVLLLIQVMCNCDGALFDLDFDFIERMAALIEHRDKRFVLFSHCKFIYYTIALVKPI